MTDHAAELRRHARKVGAPAGDVPAVMVAAADEIDRLREALHAMAEQAAPAELLALRKDAERWRWLRDEEGAHDIFSALYFNTQTPEQLDAELDSAIERTRAVG
jgi:hypothetical protein